MIRLIYMIGWDCPALIRIYRKLRRKCSIGENEKEWLHDIDTGIGYGSDKKDAG